MIGRYIGRLITSTCLTAVVEIINKQFGCCGLQTLHNVWSSTKCSPVCVHVNTLHMCNAPVFEGLLGHVARCPAHLFRDSIFLSLGNLVNLVTSVQAVGTAPPAQARCVPPTCKRTLTGQTLWQNPKVVCF